MNAKLIDIAVGKIDEHIKNLVDVLSGGGAKSYDHYKELCGKIQGFQTAQYELGDLVRRLKDNDDD
jgi:hypothetical protein